MGYNHVRHRIRRTVDGEDYRMIKFLSVVLRIRPTTTCSRNYFLFMVALYTRTTILSDTNEVLSTPHETV
jgi:hypothetical protein